MTDTIHQQLLQRNALETTPFLSVHASNATLLNQVDALQRQCSAAEREIHTLRQQLHESAAGAASDSNASGISINSTAAAAAALRNETRLRDKLEKVQEETNVRLKEQAAQQAQALKTAKELSEVKDLNSAQKVTIDKLNKEREKSERAIEHLTNQVHDANSRTELAEKQYEGLKETIRSLQEENDVLRKENREFENRIVKEKESAVDEMNILTEMVDKLKAENEMLRNLQLQQQQQGKSTASSSSSSWFQRLGASNNNNNAKDDENSKNNNNNNKWGNFDVKPPAPPPKHIVASAHAMEGMCLRFDGDGAAGELLATASSDSTVKIWNSATGQAVTTLRGSHGHSVICCDMRGGLVVGGGSDKTCRVWNLRSERMIHQLVGHAHKITCVRLFGHNVITGSADRCCKVWDISRKTYRQTATLRHSSTTNCVDVSGNTAVTGHLDGGLRFWDLRSGERTLDLPGMHQGGITSVQFHPQSGSSTLLTNGLDSCLKIVDARNGVAVQKFQHANFSTSHGWSASTFSPDGKFCAAGSSSPKGSVFVWSCADGSLKQELAGHHRSGVCAIDWNRGGGNGSQVATIDRKGVLILWA